MARSLPRTASLALLVSSLLAAPMASRVAPPAGNPASDLRLEWVGAGTPIEGRAGETVEVRYLLRNVGGRDAFAAVLAASTALGPQGARERRQPGPRAGESLPLALSLPLAEGMRELCIDAALQNLRAEDPADPNPGDNRVCRAVKARPRDVARPQGIAPGAIPVVSRSPAIGAIPAR